MQIHRTCRCVGGGVGHRVGLFVDAWAASAKPPGTDTTSSMDAEACNLPKGRPGHGVDQLRFAGQRHCGDVVGHRFGGQRQRRRGYGYPSNGPRQTLSVPAIPPWRPAPSRAGRRNNTPQSPTAAPTTGPPLGETAPRWPERSAPKPAPGVAATTPPPSRATTAPPTRADTDHHRKPQHQKQHRHRHRRLTRRPCGRRRQ